MTWESLHFGQMLLQVKDEKDRISARNSTEIPKCYETTLDSIICLFRFICKLQKLFDRPLTRLNIIKANELIDKTTKDTLTDQEKQIIDKIRAYLEAIQSIRNNFQQYSYVYQSFHHYDFSIALKRFPRWDIENVNILLVINDLRVIYSATVDKNTTNMKLDPFKPAIDTVLRTLSVNFRYQLVTSDETNELIESIILNVDTIINGMFRCNEKKKTQQLREELFQRLNTNLSKMNKIISRVDDFNKSVNSIFLNIGIIGGSMAQILRR